jgi:hypothetical protein
MLGLYVAKGHQFIYAFAEFGQICGFPVTFMTHKAHLATVIVSGYEVYGPTQTVVVHRGGYRYSN